MSSPTRGASPRPAEGAPPKIIRVRRWSCDPASAVEIALVPRASSVPNFDPGHDVHLVVADGDRLGAFIGTVDGYTGSLDRKIPIGGRYLRQPGKRRTLWSAQAPSWERTSHSYISRAEAIRDLIDTAERSGRQ